MAPFTGPIRPMSGKAAGRMPIGLDVPPAGQAVTVPAITAGGKMMRRFRTRQFPVVAACTALAGQVAMIVNGRTPGFGAVTQTTGRFALEMTGGPFRGHLPVVTIGTRSFHRLVIQFCTLRPGPDIMTKPALPARAQVPWTPAGGDPPIMTFPAGQIDLLVTHLERRPVPGPMADIAFLSCFHVIW